MANEGLVTSRLRVSKGNVNIDQSQSVRFNVGTARYAAGVQAIGTTYEQVVLPTDLSSAGFAMFSNADSTNYIEIGVEVSAAFYPLVKLLPNDPPATFRLASNTFFARAHTGACDLQYTIANT